jgi:hypothetical protein
MASVNKDGMLKLQVRTLYIYIPGLGEEGILQYQRNIIAKWSNGQRDAVFIEAEWANPNESYTNKIKRIEPEIKGLSLEKYKNICLVGTGAGGTLSFNLFMRLCNQYSKLTLVTAAGKITGSNYIRQRYSQRNSALIPSVKVSEANIDISDANAERIFTITPLFDEVIYPRFMKIPKARNKRLLVGGHIPAILYVIKFRMNTVYDFVER